MDLALHAELATTFRSSQQAVRVMTERWAVTNLYCPACQCDELTEAPTNTPAVDLYCARCVQPFQLKSTRYQQARKIVDAAYARMIEAIRSENVPNLLLLHYTPSLTVRDVILVPRFFLSESCIEQRRPLAPSARRAGWIGCNILLDRIPGDGKLHMVTRGIAVRRETVRRQYRRLAGIADVDVSTRRWLLDVLMVVRLIRKEVFTLADAYLFEQDLAGLHPHNRHVRPKIRQQLQRLRDLGIVEFLSPGVYRLAPAWAGDTCDTSGAPDACPSAGRTDSDRMPEADR